MNKGKTASQAGHAYLGAYLQALKNTPELAQEYHADGIGTKVCLSGDLKSILRAKHKAEMLGIPHFLVVDSGCPDFFNGQPTVTALGIGPAVREKITPVTGSFQLTK
jgi:peptidyl-tRNA hydrolase, PTH2 family